MKLRLIVILNCFILLGVLFRLSILNAHGLWSDEALQFWISKGINYNIVFSSLIINPPQTASWYELLHNTHSLFMGSPTFTILLYFWSKISDSVSWLRLLPCLFSIGILPLMFLIAREINFSRKWALALVVFCAWNAPWLMNSIELRPYSLEMFSSALTLFFFLKIVKNNGLLIRYYFWLAFSILLGVTSGYGYNLSLPFFFIFLVLYVNFKDSDTVIRRFYKQVVLFIPVVFLIIYLAQVKVDLVKTLLINNFPVPYLSYLKDYLQLGWVSCIAMILRDTLQVISWQLFCVRSIFLNGIFLPIGIPFLVLSGIFLACLGYFAVSRRISKSRYMEQKVVWVALFFIVICVILSIKGSVPLSPTRHNLFFSPALFVSFFICVRQFYEFLRVKLKKNQAIILLIFLFILTMLPSLVRDYQVVHSPEIRELLKRMQYSIRSNDKVRIVVKDYDLPVLSYEYHYSNILWLKRLKKEDISTDFSFRAETYDQYDYQWYIFSHQKLSDKIARERLNAWKIRLSEVFNFIVDLEYSLPPRVFGLRAIAVVGHYQD